MRCAPAPLLYAAPPRSPHVHGGRPPDAGGPARPGLQQQLQAALTHLRLAGQQQLRQGALPSLLMWALIRRRMPRHPMM